MPDLAAYAGSHGDERSEVGALFEMITRRPAWHELAACRTAPTRMTWFPEAAAAAQVAAAVCRRCPAQADCAAWAMTQGPLLKGIWGGLSERQRNSIRKASTGDPAPQADNDVSG